MNLFWNMALYAICAAAFNLSTAIYSILFSFISTTAMDKLHMQNINVEVTVVTKILSPEMEHEILVDLHRGITRYEGIGEYTGEPVHIFYILVTKYEISRLRAIVCKHDPTPSSSPRTARSSMGIIRGSCKRPPLQGFCKF